MLGVLYGLYESVQIQARKIEVKDAAVPPSFSGKKIVFISDIHYGAMLSDIRMKRIKKLLEKIKPDILLFGGDYVVTNEKFIEPCFEILKNWKAPLGKFGVLGNHDHWASKEISEKGMKNAEIVNLDNKSVWINIGKDRIKIGGVGDFWNDKQDIHETIKDTVHDAIRDDFVILLSHNPDFVETLETDKIDYVLSGHVHGGQINFFGLWAPLTYSKHGQKFVKGFVKTEKTKVIVSKGAGVVGLPLRIFATPEIVEITLKKEK